MCSCEFIIIIIIILLKIIFRIHYLHFVSISACEIESQLTREAFTDPLQYSGALPTGSVFTMQGFQ